MKYDLITSLAVVLVINISTLFAQGSDMDYTANSSTINFAGQEIAISSVLTKEGNTFTWVQNNTGTPVSYHFNITDSSGDWNQTTSMGEMTYILVLDDVQGSLRLNGDSNGMSLILTLPNLDGAEDQYTFIIDTISYQ